MQQIASLLLFSTLRCSTTFSELVFVKNSLQSLPSQKFKTFAIILKAHQLKAQPSPPHSINQPTNSSA